MKLSQNKQIFISTKLVLFTKFTKLIKMNNEETRNFHIILSSEFVS